MHTRKHCLTKKQRKNNNLTFLNNENTFLEHSITAALQVHVLQKKYKKDTWAYYKTKVSYMYIQQPKGTH